MNDLIRHLPGIECTRLNTTRLETQVLLAGSEDGEPILFLHGNLSSSTFWEETMLGLPEGFCAVAPDQRGFGLSDPSQLIDATRGFADWADDAVALADRFGWDRFHVVGHSLGGCVAWSLAGSHSERLRTVTLIAPGPPCGFPGAHGERGELNHPDGTGAGAGLTHPEFVKQLKANEKDVADPMFSPRVVMNRVYWKPPFRPQREEELLKGMLQVHIGDRQFPGDWIASTHWPGFAPGRYGPTNALSPLYNQGELGRILEAQPKPSILWIYGTADPVISDHSISDPGQQGKLRLRPDWPGESVFPPQPILRQVKFALDQYEQHGGSVDRLSLFEVGHTPYLERPLEVQTALNQHLTRNA